ncbi:adenine phosphoribosyltransferase [Synchytrium endobioticum]|uniref:adenine phosphoribosyltransferase n=1 Tax=Synchytrium endobioticum TaxID=286115 RepID=A0A507DHA9_9FUNG|nr:adenine phosphoribosyltransferase [Synchytrium endobioticum]TPX50617.1 adenine phosphoribosyltransferase [Synchytrium endobioticum]
MDPKIIDNGAPGRMRAGTSPRKRSPTAAFPDHIQWISKCIKSKRTQVAARLSTQVQDVKKFSQKMADLARIKSLLRQVPDFPKKGIMFQDIFPIFLDPVAVEMLVTHITHHITSTLARIDVIVGLDARGFLLGPTIAMRIGAAFVPVRKKGKLPGQTQVVGYDKEYGTDFFEMQVGSIKPGQTVVILDDLIATGGSAKAAGELVQISGGKVVEYIFFIELAALKGGARLDAPMYSLIQFDD